MCSPCAEIDKWPAGLDPADGELDERRDTRKKEQLVSVAQHVLSLIETSGAQRVVEVGAGSGHLGLLIAYLRPHCSPQAYSRMTQRATATTTTATRGCGAAVRSSDRSAD